jgi:hypothetical protein
MVPYHLASCFSAHGRTATGYEPGVLLVPGVPEAPDEDKALEAVVRFVEIIRRRLNDARVSA